MLIKEYKDKIRTPSDPNRPRELEDDDTSSRGVERGPPSRSGLAARLRRLSLC